MSPPTVASGGCGSATWTPSASYSPSRPAPARTWCVATVGDRAANAWWMQHLMPLAHLHLRSRTAQHRLRRSARVRRAHDGRGFSGLCRAVPRSCPRTWRRRGDGQSRRHKVAGVREASRAAKASLMHLPAYSPDLNPIEQACATLKAGLRRAGARTHDALCSTIGCLLDTFTQNPHHQMPGLNT